MSDEMEGYISSGGAFLSARLVKEKNLAGKVYKITAVGWPKMKDNTKKPALTLEGIDVPMSLNKTNAAILVEKYGTDEGKWLGNNIQIVLTKREFKGEMVDALLIVPM